MKNLTQDEVQELIDLTPSQEKAWKSLERAIKKCEKENIHFYQVLETLCALNGNNVKAEENTENTIFEDGGPRDLNLLSYPSVLLTCGWADDSHTIIFKDDEDYKIPHRHHSY